MEMGMRSAGTALRRGLDDDVISHLWRCVGIMMRWCFNFRISLILVQQIPRLVFNKAMSNVYVV